MSKHPELRGKRLNAHCPYDETTLRQDMAYPDRGICPVCFTSLLKPDGADDQGSTSTGLMSGAVEGVALREALQRIMRCMNQLIPNLSIEARRANTGAIVQAANDFADLREHLTTPPARSYVDGVPLEVAEALLPYTSHSIGCAIYQQSWHTGAPECTCGVEEARAAIRLLSQGEKA